MEASYDLIVIGSGPAGQKAAVAAAKAGRRVLVVERGGEVGGVCVHSGTIPSKALREAVLMLSGLRARGVNGLRVELDENLGVEDLISHTAAIVATETRVVREQMDDVKDSELDLVVAGTQEGVLMVESMASELSEEVMLGAVTFGHDSFQPIIQAIIELAEACDD